MGFAAGQRTTLHFLTEVEAPTFAMTPPPRALSFNGATESFICRVLWVSKGASDAVTSLEDLWSLWVL